MNDLVKLAIAKQFEKATKGLAVGVGTHNIDETVTLHIKGTVKKLEDKMITPTVNIPLKATLALVLEKAGFMRERAKELLIEAMTEAMELEAKGDVFVASQVKDIDTAMEHVKDITSKLPKTPQSGATYVKVDIEELVGELA